MANHAILNFINGRCCRYTKNISHPFISYTITITAEMIKVNEIEHENNPQ